MPRNKKNNQNRRGKKQSGPSGPRTAHDVAASSSTTSAYKQPAAIGVATRSQRKRIAEKEGKSKSERNNGDTLANDFQVAGAENNSSSSCPAIPPSPLLEPGSSASLQIAKADSPQNDPGSPVGENAEAAHPQNEAQLKGGRDPSDANERAAGLYEYLLHRDLYISVHDYVIRQVSNDVGELAGYFPSECRWEQLDDDTKRTLIKICPRAAHFVEKGGLGTQALFEAFIFRILFERLFTSEDKWANPEWSSFGSVISTRGSFDRNRFFAHAFHHGIHKMARILRVSEGPHVDTPWLLNVLRDAIKPFTDIRKDQVKKESNIDKYMSCLERALFDTAESAIRVDFAMVSSQYCMDMEMLDPDTKAAYAFSFRKNVMEEYEEDPDIKYEGRAVEFIISPLLRTYGPSRDFPYTEAELPKYFASVDGGYRKCLKSKKMIVFVDDSS